MRRRWTRLALPLLAAVMLSGCGAVRIGRILDEPARYANKSVQIEGTVERSVGAVVAGLYQVEDSTGKIYVLSTNPVPRKGARVKVKGRVMNGVTLGTRSFGTAIREENHRVRY